MARSSPAADMHPDRRTFLKFTAALIAGAAVPARAAIRLGTKPDDALWSLSATEAIARMKTGDLSAETYAAALLARTDERRELNAFIALDAEQVLEAARAADRCRTEGKTTGLLHGLPVPVKDSVLTADYPTTVGTAAFEPYAPRRDGELVRRLKEQGAIVMGKTNLHELSTGFTSNNAHFGPVRNPYDPSRIPGGSSGGTAAAVASGMAPLGIAEDTAGSIRVPAALCGIWGFRPTVGRYPNDNVQPLVPLFDQLGPHARDMNDIVLFDAAMRGAQADIKPRSLAGVRLGVPRGYFYDGVESETAIIVENTLVALHESGAVLVQAEIPDVAKLLGETFVPILFHEPWHVLDGWFRSMGVAGGLETILADAGPGIRQAYGTVLKPRSADYIPDAVYENAVNTARPALIEVVRRWYAEHRIDAMVVPQTLCPATPIGQEQETTIDGRTVSIFDALGHNTQLAPSCGLPALTVPAGLTPMQLPVAIEVSGLPGGDADLLALGLAVQDAMFVWGGLSAAKSSGEDRRAG